MAKYEGLITGLRIAVGLGIQRLLINGDSQLIVNQTSKAYQPHETQMIAYIIEVRRLEQHFPIVEARHIPRKDRFLTVESWSFTKWLEAEPVTKVDKNSTLSSSKELCLGSWYQTVSSQTTSHSSLAMHPWNTMKT